MSLLCIGNEPIIRQSKGLPKVVDQPVTRFELKTAMWNKILLKKITLI